MDLPQWFSAEAGALPGGDSWMVAVIGGSTAPDVEEVGLRGSCRTRDLTGRARGALVEKC